MTHVMVVRMHKELLMLSQAPPPGVSAWCVDSKINELEAVIQGPEDTPYEEGFFKLEINIPERYPNDPPKVRFVTPVYHPNIDNGGRICLDTLKMPPKGAWTPSLNIPSLLTTLRLLLSCPNPDDPLMPDITEEYIHNHSLFVSKARNSTRKYATNTQQTEPKTANSQTAPVNTTSNSDSVSIDLHNTDIHSTNLNNNTNVHNNNTNTINLHVDNIKTNNVDNNTDVHISIPDDENKSDNESEDDSDEEMEALKQRQEASRRVVVLDNGSSDDETDDKSNSIHSSFNSFNRNSPPKNNSSTIVLNDSDDDFTFDSPK